MTPGPEKKDRTPGPRVLFVLVAVVVEAVAALVLTTVNPGAPDRAAVALVLVVHLVAAALAGAALPGWWPGRSPETAKLGPFVFATVLAFPLVGVLAAAVLALQRTRTARQFQLVLERYLDLVNDLIPVQLIPADTSATLERYRWDSLNMRPLAEMISDPTTPEAVVTAAIAETARLAPDEAGHLLRQAQTSTVPETRYWATNALARLEERLNRAIDRAEVASVQDPGAVEPLLDLAAARLAHAELCEPEDPLLIYHLGEAIALYRTCLERVSGDDRDLCQERLAHALILSGSPAEAVPLLVELIERGVCTVPVFVACLSACYQTADWDKLRLYAAMALAAHPASTQLKEVATPWTPRPMSA